VGAISNDRKTDLVHVLGNLTAVRYRDEILQPHLMHVIDRQRELFQQDKARPHTARVSMDYLEQNNINVLPWPSKSPDLNPIEHLWDQLDKRVRQRQPPPQTLDQLRLMLQQEWRTIPRNNVRNLIESMPRRCRAVLAARDGHTRY
jgi:transposase